MSIKVIKDQLNIKALKILGSYSSYSELPLLNKIIHFREEDGIPLIKCFKCNSKTLFINNTIHTKVNFLKYLNLLKLHHEYYCNACDTTFIIKRTFTPIRTYNALLNFYARYNFSTKLYSKIIMINLVKNISFI